jgi:hypothetical protein
MRHIKVGKYPLYPFREYRCWLPDVEVAGIEVAVGEVIGAGDVTGMFVVNLSSVGAQNWKAFWISSSNVLFPKLRLQK